MNSLGYAYHFCSPELTIEHFSDRLPAHDRLERDLMIDGICGVQSRQAIHVSGIEPDNPRVHHCARCHFHELVENGGSFTFVRGSQFRPDCISDSALLFYRHHLAVMLQKDLVRIAVSIARDHMHVKMRLGLTGTSTAILKHIHPVSTEGSSGRMRNLPCKAVHTLDLLAVYIEN